jgi:hypothetical protein
MRRAAILTSATAIVAAALFAPVPTASAATTTLQLENGTIFHGTVDSDHAGFTGTGFVNTANEVGSWVEISVNVGTTGSTSLSYRFANGATTSRPMTITVDGASIGSVSFPVTGSWTSWSSASISASLSAGSHVVRATSTTANGGPNLDSLTVTDGGGGGGAPTAAELLAKVQNCAQISSGKFKTDSENSRTIPVCGANGAVFWTADMDIDCDGQRTTQCNENTDCCFQNDTAFHQSNGQPLNSAQLPYVVVPSPSSTWDYRNFGVAGATIVAVIFNNRVEYAVVGDTGPTDIIGEASYRTASDLGIDPDPSTGGTDSGVTYILFKNSQATPIENHGNAVSQGQTLARTFVSSN